MAPGLSKRSLTLICLASASWAICFGVGTQLGTLWLKDHGASNSTIGFNHAIYYLGLTLASLAAPRLFRRFGIHCSTIGLLLSALSLAMFPWASGPIGWFGWRLVHGLAGALSLIPLETLVSQHSAKEVRLRNFGFYTVALTLGGALGLAMGPAIYEKSQMFGFYIGPMFPLLSALCLLGCPLSPACDSAEDSPGATDPLDWAGNVLNFGAGWCQGFLEGGLVAFLSLYLLSLGMSKDLSGVLMGVTMAGVIVVQVPIGWLADRLGRKPVLLGCYAVVLLGLGLVPWCGASVWVGVWLAILGASSGALYPLGLALLGDRLRPGALVRAYSWFLALECIGSQMGAAAMGEARDRWGEASMFTVGLGAVGLVLAFALGTAWVQGRRRRNLNEQRGQSPLETRKVA